MPQSEWLEREFLNGNTCLYGYLAADDGFYANLWQLLQVTLGQIDTSLRQIATIV